MTLAACQKLFSRLQHRRLEVQTNEDNFLVFFRNLNKKENIKVNLKSTCINLHSSPEQHFFLNTSI